MAMESMEVGQDMLPEIVENYRDFEPPPNFRKMTEELLDSVPQKYLNGLKTITLTNRTALSRKQRQQELWSRNSKVALADCLGTCQHATKSSNAVVCLYVDNILQSWPPWIWRIPVIRYQLIWKVLYHEVGHHIHAVHKPIFEGRENVAETWEKKLGKDFFRKRYWHLVPVVYVLGIFLRLGERAKKAFRSIA
jgi:hypothetical protein